MGNILTLNSPLIVPKDQMDQALNIIEEAIIEETFEWLLNILKHFKLISEKPIEIKYAHKPSVISIWLVFDFSQMWFYVDLCWWLWKFIFKSVKNGGYMPVELD